MTDTRDERPGPDEPSDIRPVSILDEMKRSYLDYAMSVIVSRALPDVRDGLKPVHRRILYAMHELNFTPDRPYNKSSRTVGDTMGKYHPHGDLAIYDALVRMAQDFSMRVPLIDGQGNFGSVDGDPPAASRYTEARLHRAAIALLDDLDKDTVDFKPNYDEKEEEPVVLPARFPNLLVNGAGGIAVGMATNIPPHNLGETIDALLAMMDKPDISLDELMERLPGPDFPTGAAILGRAGIRSAYATGRGSIVMRAKVTVEELRKDREALIVSEIPYQVNKATLIERIAELVKEKRIEGISDLRDESDRDGMRIVIEIKRDAVADVVLNQLWRFTAMQSSFGANMIALNGLRPEMMTLSDMLRAFLDFREDVVTRRTKHLLTKARDSAHVQVGLAIAVANIDEVIRLIRTSPDTAAARDALMGRSWPARDMAPLIALIADPRHALDADGSIRLSEAQARAILELRLARLTALGRDEIAEALNKLAVEIADYLDILGSRARLMGIIRDELLKAKADFPSPRLTEILDSDADMDDEDLIQREDMVVLVEPRRLYQARAAFDLPRAAARRQGTHRNGDPRRGFRRAPVRRLDASAGAVLLFRRPGLQGEGVAAAARRADGARQGARQSPAARAGRAHDDHHADSRGRGHLGVLRRDVRHDAGHGQAQQAQRLRRGQAQRQDRDAPRRGRADRRCADLQRPPGRAADDGEGTMHPLSRRRRACVQGTRTRWE